MGAAGTILTMPLGGQNAGTGRCSLVLRSWFSPSSPRLFQNNRRKWTRSEQAWPPSSAKTCGENCVSFAERKSGADLAPTVSFWGGGAREWGRWARRRSPQSARGGRSSPGAAEALTFQGKAAARVVLPWARPHHPGHGSGQRGHPGGSFSWKLYPGREARQKGERGAGDPQELPRAWRAPPQKKAGERGKAEGRGTARS